MQLVNHEPVIKIFANGMQITFPNLYSLVIKIGMGTKSTQVNRIEDVADVFALRFGGQTGPDVEVEIYDPFKNNISEKFGSAGSIGFVTPMQLSDLMFIVSSFIILK